MFLNFLSYTQVLTSDGQLSFALYFYYPLYTSIPLSFNNLAGPKPEA